MTAETLSSKVSSVMKGAFNNEEAIGPLAVAKQLHRHYSCKSRSACREIQRERHAGDIIACGRNVGFTNVCSEMRFIYCFITDIDRVTIVEQINSRGALEPLLRFSIIYRDMMQGLLCLCGSVEST